jgi:hypothetical protein
MQKIRMLKTIYAGANKLSKGNTYDAFAIIDGQAFVHPVWIKEGDYQIAVTKPSVSELQATIERLSKENKALRDKLSQIEDIAISC